MEGAAQANAGAWAGAELMEQTRYALAVLLYKRAGLVAATVAVVSAVATGGGAQAAVVPPVANCYDLLTHDNISTRFTANHCASALTSADYNAQAYHNDSALNAVTRSSAAESVYFSAGHSIVLYQGTSREAAIGLEFESPGPRGNMDALLADPTAAYSVEGAIACDSDGWCSNSIVGYQWTTQLREANLVVLQACASLTPGTGGALSVGEGVNTYSQPGTVIGFRKEVAFSVGRDESNIAGSAWANTFWADLANGSTYSAALVDASNAAGGSLYGYDSYVMLQRAGAPTSLYPAQYYVSGVGGVQTATAAARAGSPVPVSLPSNVSVGPASSNEWKPVRAADGVLEEQKVDSGTVIRRDPHTSQVTELVFNTSLPKQGPPSSPMPRGGARLQRPVAKNAARRFASTRSPGFDSLVPRTGKYLDHGTFSEYRFEWQARSGNTWLPTRVTVGVDPTTGRVINYSSQRRPLKTRTAPKVSASHARKAARAAARVTGRTAVSQPTLEVVSTRTGQRLVWITTVRKVVSRNKAAAPVVKTVWVDAQAGTVQVVAAT